MEENQNKWLDIIKEFTVPDIIKNNAVVALAKGIGNIITSASNIPTSYFNSIANEISAKSQAKIKMIEAASDEASKLFATESDLANRALGYFGNKIIQNQVNRESVATKTISNLQQIKINGNENHIEIDIDWLTMFWDLAEIKSKDDVQEILSKVLSKEIVKPNSVSPHTLQLLTVLTSDLGDSFKRLCNLSTDDGERCFVIHPKVFAFQNIGPLSDFSVSYEDLFDLDGAGLLRSAETLMLNYGESEFEDIDIAGTKAQLNVSGQQLHLIQFTKAGRELRNLLTLSLNSEYKQAIKEKLKDAIIFSDTI